VFIDRALEIASPFTKLR